MDCPTCIPVLEREVERLEGVEGSRGNYMAKTLKVTYEPSRVQLADIEAAIERVGYRIAYKRYPSPLSRLRGLFKRDKADTTPHISDAEFPGKVLHASKTVVVLFSSPTCPACRIFEPEFRKLASKGEEKADFYEMDISTTETWRNYDILSIPTVIVFRAGVASEEFNAMPKTEDVEAALGV
jgi:thioredoxin 1